MANSLAWINAAYWTPASEATLLGWWKADSLALSNNDPVSSWSDSSSSGYTMTQTGTNRPTYQTNIKNGLPAVFFDQTNLQHLTSSMPSNTKPFTVAAVIQSGTFASHFSSLFGSTADGDLQILTVFDQLRTDRQNTSTIASPSVGFGNGLWYICVVTYDGSGNWAYLINGTAYSGTTNVSFTGAGTTLMGAKPGPGNVMDGYIPEIMKFSSVISTSKIDTYLNNKWAVR